MNKQLINEASKALTPNRIQILNSMFRVDDDFSDNNHLGDVEIQTFRNTSSLEVEELDLNDNSKEEKLYKYKYIYNVGIRGIQPNESNNSEDGSPDDVHEPKEFFEITAKYKVVYISKVEISDDCADEFAKYNVGHTVWPYWRELVQSSCVRMGINVIEIPFYKAN